MSGIGSVQSAACGVAARVMPVRGTPNGSRLIVSTMVAGAMAFAMLQSLVIPVLPALRVTLHTTPDRIAWVFTAYWLSAAVTTPIAGRLGDMFGAKRTLVVVLGILSIGTTISALAGSLAMMVAGRVVQGVGGAVFALGFAVIREQLPPERRHGAIGLLAAILGLGGAAGVCVAGPITEHLSYHWLFWVPLLFAVPALVGAVLVIPESRSSIPGRVNWLAAALLAAWLVDLLLAVTEVTRWPAARLVAMFSGAAALLLAWIYVEFTARVPLVDMRMMRRRGVFLPNVASLTIGMGLTGAMIIVPQLAETPAATGFGFGASVTVGGLFLVPTNVGMFVVSSFAGRVRTVVGSRVPLIVGAVVAMAAFVELTLAHSEPWQILVGMGTIGVGCGLALAAMASLVVEAVRPDQTGVATGMNFIMRMIGATIGGQIAASVLAANTLGSGLPTEHAYVLAFEIAAGILALTVISSLLVPREREPGRHEMAMVPARE